MTDLNNKRVLFLCPYFFGYDKYIKEAIEQQGATVDYFDERPSNSTLTKALLRINPNIIKRKIKKYHNDIIEQTKNTKYDYIFILKAEAITITSLEKLRQIHPSATMIHYIFDSFDNYGSILSKLNIFDKLITFDRQDAQQYNQQFVPLFYINKYRKIAESNQPKKIDLLFIGTIHSDRYIFLDKIKKSIEQMQLSYFYYMFFMSKLLFLKMKTEKLLGTSKYSDFQFKSLTQDQIIEYIKQSKIILDIQHPAQRGLTMRTIETVGAKKKLITTNIDIKNYDFYNSNNILIIERENPVLNTTFLTSDYQEIPNDIYEKYSLENWVRSIFETT